MNVKAEDVRKTLQQIVQGERIKLIIPDSIRGHVTVRLKDVPWDQAFEAVLESQGLWYRYSKDSNSITVLVNLNVGSPPDERFERYRSDPP